MSDLFQLQQFGLATVRDLQPTAVARLDVHVSTMDPVDELVVKQPMYCTAIPQGVRHFLLCRMNWGNDRQIKAENVARTLIKYTNTSFFNTYSPISVSFASLLALSKFGLLFGSPSSMSAAVAHKYVQWPQPRFRMEPSDCMTVQFSIGSSASDVAVLQPMLQTVLWQPLHGRLDLSTTFMASSWWGVDPVW